jgi:hypothetical protein
VLKSVAKLGYGCYIFDETDKVVPREDFMKHKPASVLAIAQISFTLCLFATYASADEINWTSVATIETGIHLGEGAAISPDGKSIVYIKDDGLHLRDLVAGTDHLLLKEAAEWTDVFVDPAFAPDGQRILVGASGGTSSYAGEIYSVRLDRALVQKVPLLNSRSSVGAGNNGRGNKVKDWKDYYSAVMSPSSGDMLLGVYDRGKREWEVGFVAEATSQVQIVEQGCPVGWSADGASFFYTHEDELIRFDPGTNQRETLLVKGNLLGELPESDTFVVDDGTNIMFASLRKGKLTWQESTIPRLLHISESEPGPLSEELTLQSVQGSKRRLMLLVYRGDSRERLELVRLAGEN